MKSFTSRPGLWTICLVLMLGLTAPTGLLADGTETLGPLLVPSIPQGNTPLAIASGTGIICKGVGLANGAGGTGMITFDVPAGATVKQVFIYWEGQTHESGSIDVLFTVNGFVVAASDPADFSDGGDRIGAPILFYVDPNNGVPIYTHAYRKDITSLGLVGPGTNNLFIAGLDGFGFVTDGVGVMVIYEEPGIPASTITLRDGIDLAFVGFPEPKKNTVPQIFTFPAAAVARTATLSMMFSSVHGSTSGYGFRPNSIEVTVGANPPIIFTDLLDSQDGPEWDSENLPILIPAGVTSLKVQAFSRDDLGRWNGNPVPPQAFLPASFFWLAAGLSVPTPCEGVIGDLVWMEGGSGDCDGIQNTGDQGIPNVTVRLKNSGGTVIATTTTNANGIYRFENLCPGDYTVEVDESTLPPGVTPTTCANTPNIANNSNCSPSPVTLPNANSQDLTIDFGYCPPDEPCPSREIGPDGKPLATMTVTVDPNGDVNVRLDQSRFLNDNSYGVNAIGWGGPNKHKFSELVGSDKARFVFKNGNGQTVLDIYVDYISLKAGTPSGYGSLGVSGAEGKVNSGSAAHVLMATSSLDLNLNTLGLCAGGNCNTGGVNLLVDSPPADANYNVANPIFNNWDFTNSYIVKISGAAFGASGFGSVASTDLHNSPSKGGRKVTTFTCPDVPSNNVCEGGVKPGTLTLKYTGANCGASNNPQSGKATCTDHAALQNTVRILITDKSNPSDSKAKKWFDGLVSLNSSFDMKASNGGASNFSADSYYFIYSTGGQLLQSGKFHTSCSQPLEVGNQFGSLLLTGFKPAGVPKLIEDLELMPEAFRLLQNYPNPFNPQTEIYFQMAEAGHVTLSIYNTLGQEVKTLVDGFIDAGIHNVTWDATDNSGRTVSSGIYFYQMRSGDFTAMKKMSLLR